MDTAIAVERITIIDAPAENTVDIQCDDCSVACRYEKGKLGLVLHKGHVFNGEFLADAACMFDTNKDQAIGKFARKYFENAPPPPETEGITLLPERMQFKPRANSSNRRSLAKVSVCRSCSEPIDPSSPFCGNCSEVVR